MQKLQLYIGTQRLELFKDETVSFTQTLKNVKDIAKIFTEFTKTFSVPASKNNNKVFSHYYNFHINSPFVFDARQKVNASIELNDLPFKTGKVRLEGVDLKNNLAHTYRITFFGNTVDLKDILGGNQLSSLTSLNSLNQVYTYNQVKSRLGQSSNNGNILVPLITHTTRMIYNSGIKGNNGVNGNAYYNTNNATRGLLNGIDWNEFKYAIRVQAIIDAIQTQYPSITFSSDFFNKTYPTNARFTNLFMWLHRNKGGVQTFDGGFTYTLLTDLGDINHSGAANQIGSVNLGGLIINSQDPDTTWTLKLKVLPVEQAITYNIRVTNTTDGNTREFNNVTGNQQQADLPLSFDSTAGTYTVEIGTSSTVNFNAGSIEFQVDIIEREGSDTLTGTTTYSNANAFVTTPDLDFNIIEQIPKLKIIDFLSGIFKMFNLVAYVNDAGVIVVKEVDEYYLSSVNRPPINIDKYLDTTKSQVDVALPFSSVSFSYKGLGTFLAKQYEQINNSGWGSTSFSLDNAIYDAPEESYKVELPFEHMMYERLYNVVNNVSTTIQFGYFVDDNQEPYYGEPLLFYPILQNSSTTTINLKNPIVSPVTVEELNTYFIPSNSLTLIPLPLTSTSAININFNNEINEYLANENGSFQNAFTDTLFEEYYKTYITNIFNVRRRLTKVTAYLPMKIYYNLELDNTIQLGQNNYWINSMNTDLTTGKTKFELLNKLDAEPQPQ